MEEPPPVNDVFPTEGAPNSVGSPAGRVWAAWSIPVVLACLACGESADSGLVTSSDPSLASIAVRILPDLASRSGMELRSPVRVERRSRADLERYLEFKIEEEFPEGRAQSLSEDRKSVV